MHQQAWLSLDGICNVLQTSVSHIRWLVSHNYLETLPGSKPGIQNARFLDPTPAYADRLRTTEMIYQRRVPLPADMDMSGKAIFTRAEMAVILGWTDNYARGYLKDNEVPCVKIGKIKHGGLNLYTAQTLRSLLWRRRGRKLSKQKAPFLISDLIEWFLKQDAIEIDGIPTDAEFAEDALFQKKLKMILKMPSPQKEAAMRELWSKVELAKQAATSLL